jgi:drug/metabolite transporter (DMT)-like permease
MQWALGHYGLTFPLALTCSHMAFSFVALAPFALRTQWEVHQRTLAKQWPGILYIGCFMALNIALNNISLLDISLSLNQVIRSSIPVVTCGLAVLVESRMPTQQELIALIVLTVGVMIAVWQGTIAGKPYAIFFCIMGTICNGAMMTFSGKVLSEKLDVVRLTFYTAPVSLACLAPFLAWRELDAFYAYYSRDASSVAGIMLASCVNAVCYNMVHALMIKHTSAVTTTVLGEVKVVGLLLLSALLLGEGKEFTAKMLLGCTLAMAGFIMYSQQKIAKLRGSPSAGILPVVIVDEKQPLKQLSSQPPTKQ